MRERRLRCTALLVLASVVGCNEPHDEGASAGKTDSAAEGDGDTGAGGESEGSSSGAVASSTAASESSESGDVEETGTAALPFACEDESECVLHSDCCDCTALHADEPAPTCAMSCDRNACEAWGVSEMICAHTCHLRLVECDPAMVTCDDTPPTCEAGFAPTVDLRCWSGYCVPDELCRV